MDEVRMYNRALSDSEVAALAAGVEVVLTGRAGIPAADGVPDDVHATSAPRAPGRTAPRDYPASERSAHHQRATPLKHLGAEPYTFLAVISVSA